MNKLLNSLILLSCLTITSFSGQSQNNDGKKNIDNYKAEILSEDEMRVTTDKAMKIIQNKSYDDLRKLFAEDIAKNISEQQIVYLVDQINLLFKSEGVPTGNENIVPTLKASVNGNDTLFINTMMYNFKPYSIATKSFRHVLIFSFLKKYGTQKLAGINVVISPFLAGNKQPTIKPFEDFELKVSDITHFRIFYDEGANRKTKFKNEIGYFAVEGDSAILEKSGIKPIVQTLFSELEKIKFENPKVFSSTLIYNDNVKFIQAEFEFKDKPYLLFIYLPIENSEQYSNKIVIQQREYANLGYEFVLNQIDYPLIVLEFPKIAELKLDKYYSDKP